MTVVSLHKSKPCDEVASTLRRIVDDIEAGKFDWPVTTAVLICGHTDSEVPGPDGQFLQASYWETFGMGPRADSFTIRGLMQTAQSRWSNDPD